MPTQSPRFPQPLARLAGALYAFIIAAGIYGEVIVRGSLIVPGNSAATLQRIIDSQFFFRTGIVADLLMHLCDLPLTLIFYLLLKPISKNLSLLAALFSLMQTAMLCANKLNLVAVVILLTSPDSRNAFDLKQLQSLVSVALSLHEHGFAIGLLFFGASCLIAGYLIYRSTYLPKTIGFLQGVAGVCYLLNTLAILLSPSLAGKLFPVILLPAFFGELATALWLLIRGVNVQKWNNRLLMNQSM